MVFLHYGTVCPPSPLAASSISLHRLKSNNHCNLILNKVKCTRAHKTLAYYSQWISNKGMKHELRATGATPGFVLCAADLFSQISSLKMFGQNLSDCLGLLYSRRDRRACPKPRAGNRKQNRGGFLSCLRATGRGDCERAEGRMGTVKVLIYWVFL